MKLALEFWYLIWIIIFIPIFIIFLKNKVSKKKIIIYSIFYFYSVWIFSLSFINFDSFSVENFKITDFINLIPFRVFSDDLILLKRWILDQAFLQTFWNFILLLPAWFFIPIIFWKIKNFKEAFIWWFWISFIIESIQLFITFITQSFYKIFDIDDIILNTFWFILWFCFYKIFKKLFIKKD